MTASLIKLIVGLLTLGLVPLGLFFINAKMYYHFYYLKRTKGYFSKSTGMVDYILHPLEIFDRPMEFIEMIFPWITRDTTLENDIIE